MTIRPTAPPVVLEYVSISFNVRVNCRCCESLFFTLTTVPRAFVACRAGHPPLSLEATGKDATAFVTVESEYPDVLDSAWPHMAEPVHETTFTGDPTFEDAENSEVFEWSMGRSTSTVVKRR